MINSQRQAHVARAPHNPKRYYSTQHSRSKQSPSPLSSSVNRSQVQVGKSNSQIPQYCKYQNQPRQGSTRKPSFTGTKQTSVQTSMTNLSQEISASKRSIGQNMSAYDMYLKDHKLKTPVSQRIGKSPIEVSSVKKEENKELFQALQNLKESTKKRKGVPQQIKVQNERSRLLVNGSNRKNLTRTNLNRSTSVNRAPLNQSTDSNILKQGQTRQKQASQNLPLINSTTSSFVYEDIHRKQPKEESGQRFQSPMLKSPNTSVARRSEIHGIYNGTGRSSLNKNSKSTSALDTSHNNSSLGEGSVKKEGRGNVLQRKLEQAQKKLSQKERYKAPSYLLERKMQKDLRIDSVKRETKLKQSRDVQILIEGDQSSLGELGRDKRNLFNRQSRLGNSERLSPHKPSQIYQSENAFPRKNVVAQTVDTSTDFGPTFEVVPSMGAMAQDVECIEQIHGLFVTFFQRKRVILQKVEAKGLKDLRRSNKGETEQIGNLVEVIAPERDLQ